MKPILIVSALLVSVASAQTLPQRAGDKTATTRSGESVQATPTAVNAAVPERTTGRDDPGRDLAPPERHEDVPIVQTDFEKDVEESLGHPLPIFGQELFKEVPTTFAPVDQVPITTDYVIGPGDEVLLRVWGSVEVDLRLTVDRNGQVQIPKVGTVVVAGLRYEQLPGYLRSSIGRLYREFDMTVSLGQLRSVQVFVVGFAKRPGVYSVSALSTLVNAIFAAGGPSSRGSMRRVELRRSGKMVSEFDLYELLARGDKSKDSALLPGDVIYFPPVGAVAAVEGRVQYPAIYELKEGSSLGDLIELAGGVTPAADPRRATIERIERGVSRRVIEVSLDDRHRSQKLVNGDVIRVGALSPKFEQTVTIRGNVAVPGRYEFRSGMRISDLIPSRQLLITKDYWEKQNRLGLSRREQDGIEAEDDKTTAEKSTGLNDGEEHHDATRLRNEVQREGSDINWAYALVQRMQPDLSTQLLPFNLGRALDDPGSTDNIELHSGDVITIFSQADIAVPANRQSRYVRVEGEVAAAGVYRVEPGETLRDVLRRAGGPTPQAYLFAAQFTRESVKAEQSERYKRYLDELEQQLSRHATEPSRDKQDAEEKSLEIERQQRMLREMRKVQPTGRIVLGMTPNQHDGDAFPPVELEDGDRLFIPRQPATVNVMGAVFNENAFLFAKGDSLKSYLQRAGGGTRDADEGKTFVLRADGSLVSRSSWTGRKSGFGEILPGDTIVVPLRMERTSFMKNLRDWSQVISQFALGAAAIKVLEN